MQTCDTSNAPNDEGQHRRNKKPCTQYWQLYLVFRPCRREEEGLAQRRCAACLALCILRSPTSTNKPVVAPLRMPKAEASNPLQTKVSQRTQSASGTLTPLPTQELFWHVNQGVRTTASSWSPRPSSSILRAASRTGETSWPLSAFPVALIQHQHPHALQRVATCSSSRSSTACRCFRRAFVHLTANQIKQAPRSGSNHPCMAFKTTADFQKQPAQHPHAAPVTCLEVGNLATSSHAAADAAVPIARPLQKWKR